jgi:hypothetical protein
MQAGGGLKKLNILQVKFHVKAFGSVELAGVLQEDEPVGPLHPGRLWQIVSVF